MRSRPLASSASSGRTSRYWPPIMPDRPTAETSSLSAARAHVAGRVLEVAHEREGVVQERVAGEHGDVLAVDDVRGRAPAPQGVVVERRQVVVHERERVHELERERGRQRVLGLAAEPLRRRQAEHRPHALAAGEQRVAHRLGERRDVGGLAEVERRQADVDQRAQPPERGRAVSHRRARPARRAAASRAPRRPPGRAR